MANINQLSNAVIQATEKELEKDPVAKEIAEIIDEIAVKKSEITDLEAKLHVAKGKRPDVQIKWRESIKWCLDIDSENPRYFIKNAAGVYKCIAFKHTIDITAEIKTKITVTLSSLFKDKQIGRVMHNGVYYYGIKEFFKDGLEELKDNYVSNLDKLIL
ncbi:hypothetical protein BDD43_4090 [Mucilaginibacter gracilis]|uniref:Uncharacterized protein n=1 Tax=Mucilaginibacter gracilis TaxID=423350 RepID=A0A495J4G8_9SPHI|nr:hypothetical protein [Mucilaginibacter gracilis]RKR83875.1 hypothetical protein BDD43_4090 [Mucilaginibacter gracilis]